MTLKFSYQQPVGEIRINEDWSGEGNGLAGLQWPGGVVLRYACVQAEKGYSLFDPSALRWVGFIFLHLCESAAVRSGLIFLISYSGGAALCLASTDPTNNTYDQPRRSI